MFNNNHNKTGAEHIHTTRHICDQTASITTQKKLIRLGTDSSLDEQSSRVRNQVMDIAYQRHTRTSTHMKWMAVFSANRIRLVVSALFSRQYI